ncbi:Transcriptional repressor EED/ESC/FIE, required for transcriptional silencing, WD repeat superfamily [Trachipleistophora hominis]|uniref:Transcriptional repressor EED/ESC/FIE, required for transcriptional silencing, WD repeat superfamily n=1 Tax=Trachipleistophora hominis TaxID=72359 RepID=L7JWW4_TRAHO|nr:Transcriptional repressor EED/ESC/FIE, required for transcriptional silencing, WD repeat superfamily [Trachipleistophora hominis]
MEFVKRTVLSSTFVSKICLHRRKKIFCVYGRRNAYIMNHDLEQLQKYLDEDDKEEFLSCTFYDLKDKTLLVLAGERGILKIIDLCTGSFYMALKGHGGPIIDMLHKEVRPNIVFSASSDTTIRMWDLQRACTLVIFGGLAGHEDVVLSIDISVDGNYLVSSGTDNSIKVWSIPNITSEVVIKDRAFTPGKYHFGNSEFNYTDIPVKTNFPIFNSQVLHKAYINCVKFFGNVIISKNISKRLSIVKFKGTYEIYKNSVDSDVIILKEYKFKEKLIHRFTIFGTTLVVFDEKGNCYTINLSLCNEPVLAAQIDNVKDASLINNLLFIVSNNNEVHCYTINKY